MADWKCVDGLPNAKANFCMKNISTYLFLTANPNHVPENRWHVASFALMCAQGKDV